MDTRSKGTEMEKKAEQYLAQEEVWILAHNFRCRFGEVDLVGKDGDYLVFFEVKYRSSDQSGDAAEAVNARKQKKICQVADFYRGRHVDLAKLSVRFDVLAIEGEEIRWIKDAFPYQGKGF
ncbi:MAG: YraN family protein [Lachnospiraceae bacterium]|nr:YraN family protein [Lachnospiraceae bacterium]